MIKFGKQERDGVKPELERDVDEQKIHNHLRPSQRLHERLHLPVLAVPVHLVRARKLRVEHHERLAVHVLRAQTHDLSVEHAEPVVFPEGRSIQKMFIGQLKGTHAIKC